MVVQVIEGQPPTIPEYNQFPLYSLALRMLISNGEYVLLNGESICDNSQKNRNGEIVIQLTSYDDSRNLIYGNQFILLSSILEPGRTGQDENGTAVRPIRSGVASGIDEFVKTNNRTIAHKTDIMHICFMFKESD